MHRSNRVLYRAFAGLVLGLLLGGLPATVARAQPAPAAPGTNALIVPINGTQLIRMTTGKRIKTAFNQKENIARVQAVLGSPEKVSITGVEAGVTHVTLTDEDGKTEEFDVIVQIDVEFLRTQIKRAVPTANVEPIPVSNNTIVLKGVVEHAEDVDTIMGIARGVAGNQVINRMQVGGVQQVELCVTVAAVSRQEFRRMAFNFTVNRHDFSFASLVGQADGLPGATVNVGGITAGTLGNPNGAQTNLFTGFTSGGTTVLFFLQALKDENVVKVLAEPKLTTLSGRPASFLSGGEQAIPVPAGLGQVGVQFEEFGTRLNILPIVLGDGRIHLEVEPEFSDLNAAFGTSINGTIVPGRTTERVHTTVELEDGQTFIIGGLIQHTLTGTTSKVPVLGEIPFLSAAFSSKSFSETEQELVFLVTPHLVDGMACNQVEGKLLPGQETRSPDDFELFLESILEAPRGQRQINFPCGYEPAYKSSPTASTFPCGVTADGHGRLGSCGAGGTCGSASATGSPLAPISAAPGQPRPSASAAVGDDAVQPAPNDAPTASQPSSSSNGRPTILPPLPVNGAGAPGQP
jgi:pilus assembly protein CpaC